MSPVPAALRNRLEAFDAAVREGGDPMAQLDIPPPDEEKIILAERPPIFNDAGELDLGAFTYSDAADSPAPQSPPSVVTQTPAPLTAAELQQVQAVDPNLATYVLGMQQQVTGLVAELASMRREQADAASLRAKLKELEDANRALVSARQQTDALIDLPQAEGLSAEDRQLFQDPRILAVIERAAHARAVEVARTLADQFQTKITALEARLAEQANSAAQSAQRSAEAALRANLQRSHPDADKVFHDPAFATFLQLRAPFGGGTFGEALQRAWRASQADVVADIVTEFKTRRDAAASTASAASSGAAPAALPATQIPVVSPTQTGTPTPTARPTLRASLYRQASAAFRSKRLTPEEFARVKALYDLAEREGRVLEDEPVRRG
jgi:hypothetical protein